MSFGEWFGEELLGLLVSVILFGLLLLAIYFAIRRVKDRWWIWAGGISTLFIILVIYISPVLLAPLFNEYSELPNGPLKEEILSLARANGIPANKVYQFDASKQSKRISANVNGIGNTIRISLNDNLLNRCNTEEIKAVMAHEMGHYVLNHVQGMILLFSLMFFIGFWLLHISFRWIWKKWGKQLNISGISDIGGLPLIMVLLAFYLLLSTPLINNIVRSNEVEADIFGLNAAREPDGFASVAMMLSEYRKVSPGHWEEVIFCDHPSPRSRVMMAMKWKAENLDSEQKSDELIKD
jgi:STE24 endopeptidase